MSRPIKLISVGHSFVVRLNRRLVHELANAGKGRWDVTCVAPDYFHGGRDLRPVKFLVDAPEPARLESVPAHLTRFVHVFFYGGRLKSILKERWDVVHCWEEPYILSGAQLARWTPAGSVLVFRTAQSLVKRYPPPFNWLERQAMHRADGWICCGQTVADTLNRKEIYRQRKMLLSPLGVDLEYFYPDKSAGEGVLRELGWDVVGPPVVGYLGRFTPEKGLSMLMTSLDQVEAPWRMLFVGAGPMEPELRAWAARHPERVRICTDVTHDHVPRYLNAMDLMVAPSLTTPQWREQFGRMLVEAFAAGVPVIGSDSGEIPFVIGEAGLVATEGDVDAWRDAIGELLSSPAKRAELAERGLERAREMFSWPDIARQYLAFFEELLERRQSNVGAPFE
jgi:glycosyltransferase involved in cell wall biosynthesis